MKSRGDFHNVHLSPLKRPNQKRGVAYIYSLYLEQVFLLGGDRFV